MAYLGLGANLGAAVATLASARDQLAALPQSRLVAASALYRTAPVGGPAGQPDYFNAVLALATALEPTLLLEHALAIEGRFGRRRLQRWGPRTLDIDLLLFGERLLDLPGLQLPHPRLHQRRFVLEPLCELAAELLHPRLGVPLRQLLAKLPGDDRVERLNQQW
ncbi:2-amino-4-hydroxy-6- hydroxymethyldihydropteridine pyrophosphokinase [Desulfuromonas sp. DDH964]|uniref:2-amino-4-hydroxy-6- hydroxymethyldihydropteridine diphosphokinase n=1 Tax=Desulfuromonas sp. DDH964 TaxID=1823759 RepID=UPI00078EC713|nr:2-amino-4-hydroxy-6-hydroxymethyldihydropteridine diphosphokinase [Desulfuromonas sp. DDH964]AMV71038.1 2-amino-4-hydroxy-6- hydroxymethyldihydropteridine pyrophosphokinase [Desulfuromonas sp. DDH964]